MQIGKDDDIYHDKGIEISIYYASKWYKYYGESGQDTNIKLFWKNGVWKFDMGDSFLPCGFLRGVSGG